MTSPHGTAGAETAESSQVEQRLAALGHTLPEVAVPLGSWTLREYTVVGSVAHVFATDVPEAVRLLAIDPHAPMDLRANAVRNLTEFHEAFDVTEGDGMWVPEDERVRIF